jgi:hypothetical protein
MEKPPSVYTKGYSATREHAMADFKVCWFHAVNNGDEILTHADIRKRQP